MHLLMATLREHVEARKVSTTLNAVDRETFKQALARTYSEIRSNVWPGQTPEPDEFVAVVLDQLELHGRLTPDEFKQFRLLRKEIKTEIALEVGP